MSTSLETEQRAQYLRSREDLYHLRFDDLVHGVGDRTYLVIQDNLIQHGILGLAHRIDDENIWYGSIDIFSGSTQVIDANNNGLGILRFTNRAVSLEGIANKNNQPALYNAWSRMLPRSTA